MSMVGVGITGFLVMLGLMLAGMPIGAVMLLVGLTGGMLAFGPAFLTSSASVVWGVMSENTMTAIPLFVLLGEFLLRSGMADRMYVAFAAWLGRLPGGLLHTNIGCCALFAATSARRSRPRRPSARRPALAAAAWLPDARFARLAGGGRHAWHHDPAKHQLHHLRLDDEQLGRQAVPRRHYPGLGLALAFMAYIYISNSLRGTQLAVIEVPRAERIRLLRNLVEPLSVFGVVMGTLYFGIATATESAALGLVTVLAFIVAQGKAEPEPAATCFLASARTTGMILLIVAGAFVLNLALSLTGIGEAMTKWVTGFGLSRVQILCA